MRGELISQAVSWGMSVALMELPFPVLNGLGAVFPWVGGGGEVPPWTTSFSGSPLGLLGAPPAMPLLNGPALSTALLQLALQTQSQKVTSGLWATGSLLTHPAAPHGSISNIASSASGELTISGAVGPWTESLGPGSQVLRK